MPPQSAQSPGRNGERDAAERRAATGDRGAAGGDPPTRRATVPALEEILYDAAPVLDHGFVRVIDYMGDDGAIVQAARVSYGRGTRRVSEDRGLINYLMRHRHTTPFEMCEIKYHVKLPIFVARQWIRHRTANVNEYSAAIRSSITSSTSPPPNTSPPKHRRTARAAATCSKATRRRVLDLFREDSERAYAGYSDMLNEDETGTLATPHGPASLVN